MDERLNEARAEIARVDAEMAELFRRRMAAAAQVAAYKKDHGLPILDAQQEQRVLERCLPLMPEEGLRELYADYLRSLMELSKRYQRLLTEGRRVAYSGVPGAFAYIAAQRIFPDALLVPFPSFADAYGAVERGECDSAVIPIENSYAGDVGPVIDLMFEGGLHVSGVYSIPVVQNLLGLPGATTARVKRVVSHPQALHQCEGFIRAHGLETVTAANTAAAAKEVARAGDMSVAAIASAETAELYGLQVLEKRINDAEGNTTRFAVFSRGGDRPDGSGGSKFILMFVVRDAPGALAAAINVIGDCGFNMKVLRSYPYRKKAWQFYFYVEAEGDERSAEGRRMLEQLAAQCEKLKVAGHYAAEADLKDGESL